ncbi:MAG: LysM peptidoglycan-binding domain-containing protein [Candidatus Thiodiazotropha sp.]
MKLFKGIKFTALIAIILSIAVGCASTPQEQQPAEDPVAMAQAAIADAKAANEKAKAAGAAWRDTDDMIAEAEKALADGDTGTAIQLAEKARRQAENALSQKMAEDQRLGMATASMDTYTVMAGDSLWAISGKSEVYGNPYQWPLIYKANRGKIKDADLIYPGQEFSILLREPFSFVYILAITLSQSN